MESRIGVGIVTLEVGGLQGAELTLALDKDQSKNSLFPPRAGMATMVCTSKHGGSNHCCTLPLEIPFHFSRPNLMS